MSLNHGTWQTGFTKKDVRKGHEGVRVGLGMGLKRQALVVSGKVAGGEQGSQRGSEHPTGWKRGAAASLLLPCWRKSPGERHAGTLLAWDQRINFAN